MPDCTTIRNMSEADFDRWMTKSEYLARKAITAGTDALAAALARAGVKAGTFVDTTPPPFARRLHPEFTLSGCGSPAELCTRATGR